MLPQKSPEVSIIITTYNHAQYISKAIKSTLNQTFLNIEVIVVDDGSTDNTKEIVLSFPQVIYHYQNNKGLSNARNTGLNLARCKYILFLDADDWLYPSAIETNLKYHLKNDQLGFVSGNHFKIFINDSYMLYYDVVVESDHYLHLLKGNYIGMHATVMYNSNILKQYSFDQTLKTCEDYDLYLKVAKNHPVLHHGQIIAAYRLHTYNMSVNYSQMLKDALLVLKRQYISLTTDEERRYYREGRKKWVDYYTKTLYWQKLRINRKVDKKDVLFLLKYNPNLFFRYVLNYLVNRK